MIAHGHGIFIHPLVPQRKQEKLAKVSLCPKCLWPKCHSGQSVTGQSVTIQRVDGQIVSPAKASQAKVSLAKRSLWPKCHSGQSVSGQSVTLAKVWFSQFFLCPLWTRNIPLVTISSLKIITHLSKVYKIVLVLHNDFNYRTFCSGSFLRS